MNNTTFDTFHNNLTKGLHELEHKITVTIDKRFKDICDRLDNFNSYVTKLEERVLYLDSNYDDRFDGLHTELCRKCMC